MRIFAGEWVKNVLTRLGMQEGEAIESRMVSRRVEGAQKKVEERNFEIRKNLLEYDEVMDEQRKRVYGYRQRDSRRRQLQAADHGNDRRADRPPPRTNFWPRTTAPATFAKWAGRQLGVELEAARFPRHRFRGRRATGQGRGRAAWPKSQVIDAIDENLPEEEENEPSGTGKRWPSWSTPAGSSTIAIAT